MKTNRVTELLNAMKSFSKDKYRKDELLTEMFALQEEIVGLTFNGEHASTADLRIWDVEKHLEQLNQECGGVANEELQRFEEGSKKLCNLIKAEISGNIGENRAFRTLQYIHSKKIILKNVELSHDDRRSELDAIVITPAGITIVEVKNTAKNIFIDDNGNYYRTGEFLRWDCNIAEKMALKEELLRVALANGGIDNIQITSVVVFTDNRIEVQNKCPAIKTCFVSQLAYLIDDQNKETKYTDEAMKQIESSIRETESKESYPFDFDVAKYKMDFALLMATLEEASANGTEANECEKAVDDKKNVWQMLRSFFTSDGIKYAGSMAAGAIVTIITAGVIKTIKK